MQERKKREEEFLDLLSEAYLIAISIIQKRLGIIVGENTDVKKILKENPDIIDTANELAKNKFRKRQA